VCAVGAIEPVGAVPVRVGLERRAFRGDRAVERGGIGGDETVNFVVGRHDAGSACSNGWARPIYDLDAGAAVLELHDLTVLGRGAEPRSYSREALFAALWQRINTVLAATVG